MAGQAARLLDEDGRQEDEQNHLGWNLQYGNARYQADREAAENQYGGVR
jgi:hypothetical protein